VSNVFFWFGTLVFWGAVAAPVVYWMVGARDGYERREDLAVEAGGAAGFAEGAWAADDVVQLYGWQMAVGELYCERCGCVDLDGLRVFDGDRRDAPVATCARGHRWSVSNATRM
jgi:hypothetical protein